MTTNTERLQRIVRKALVPALRDNEVANPIETAREIAEAAEMVIYQAALETYGTD